MATDSRTLPAFFNTDADFRTWCQGIAAQLVVAGMVQTADTGQINNTTVTKPAGTNTAQGYEIYKFNDGLQAGTPVYFKIEYGSAGAVDRPSLWFTVGSGSNGSGTITGAGITTRAQIYQSVSKSAGVTLSSYCSGDAGGFALLTSYDTGSTNCFFIVSIDRITDAAGNATTDGFSIQQATSSSAFIGPCQCVIGGVASTQVASQAFMSPKGANSGGNVPGGGARVNGAQVGVMPAIILAGQVRFSKRWVSYNNADLPGEATTFTASNLGAVHTYLLNAHTAPCALFQAAPANDSVAILWE